MSADESLDHARPCTTSCKLHCHPVAARPAGGSYLSHECLARRTTKFPEGKTERLNEGTAQLFHIKCKNVATAPEAQKCWNLAENLKNAWEKGGIKSVNCSSRCQRRCNFLIGSLTEVISCAVCNELHTIVQQSLDAPSGTWLCCPSSPYGVPRFRVFSVGSGSVPKPPFRVDPAALI